jgi:hypothetical protein
MTFLAGCSARNPILSTTMQLDALARRARPEYLIRRITVPFFCVGDCESESTALHPEISGGIRCSRSGSVDGAPVRACATADVSARRVATRIRCEWPLNRSLRDASNQFSILLR